MSKAVGFVLILAGIGVASSWLAIGSDADWDAYRTGIAESRSTDDPHMTAMVQAKQPPASASPAAGAKPQAATQRAAPPPARQASAQFSAPVVVTVPQRVEQAPPTAKHTLPRMPRDRAALARDLQLELRRVGCYGGELNGVWTPATRLAMKAFTERVNATLPVEDPDDILLTLVQAHQGEVCGRPCPAGQGRSDDGRCLPSAILAQAAKKSSPAAAPTALRRSGQTAEKPAPAIAGWSTTTAAAVPAPPPGPAPIGRMALAGPRTDAPPVAAEPPSGLPALAVQTPDKRVDVVRRGRPARAYERQPPRFAQRTYARRSNFVESVLRDPRSLN
jgi:hypothetical protein